MSHRFLRVTSWLLAATATACGSRFETAPDAAHSGHLPFDHCYPNSLPTCANGDFKFDDYYCAYLGSDFGCSSMGNGACIPFCGDAGQCPSGTTCGCLRVYRCTDRTSIVRVCASDPSLECPSSQDAGAFDAGAPNVGVPDAGIPLPDAGS